MASIYNNQDFIESLLKHLCLSKKVFKKAKELKLTGDDLLFTAEDSIQCYKHTYDLLLILKGPPVDIKLYLQLLDSQKTNKEVTSIVYDQVITLLLYIFDGSKQPLMEDYFIAELPKFIKARRAIKIITSANGNIDQLVSDYSRLIVPLNNQNNLGDTGSLFVRPFQTLLRKSIVDMVHTGFSGLDQSLGGGFSLRSYTLMVGFSGGGKSTFACNIGRGAALTGHKVLYISMEEMVEDMSNRLYAATYEIDYTTLHNGTGYLLLEQKFNDPEEQIKRQILTENFVFMDLKGKTPLTSEQLYELIVRSYNETQFLPDLVIVDQMQFLTPNFAQDNDQEWNKELRISTELNQLSDQGIGDSGKHFALLVLHQARGKTKVSFTREDVAGCKGIDNKPQTCFGIGRPNPTSNDFIISSWKNRHAANFSLNYTGDLTHMRFIEGPSATLAPTNRSTEDATTAVQLGLANMATTTETNSVLNVGASRLAARTPRIG